MNTPSSTAAKYLALALHVLPTVPSQAIENNFALDSRQEVALDNVSAISITDNTLNLHRLPTLAQIVPKNFNMTALPEQSKELWPIAKNYIDIGIALVVGGLTVYGAIQALFRIFPNKIHIDGFSLGKTSISPDSTGGESFFLAQSIKVTTLPEMFGKNIFMLRMFHKAMKQAKRNPQSPFLRFENSAKSRKSFRGSPHELLVRGYRSRLSEIFGDSIMRASMQAAEARYAHLHIPKHESLFQPIHLNFEFYTYERVCDVQLRDYSLSAQDTFSYLLNLKEVFEAAERTGGGAVKRVVLLIEAATSIIQRYPTALRAHGFGEHLERASKIAKDLFRMHAMPEESSEVFLKDYIYQVAGQNLEPSEREKRYVKGLWYGTKDKASQERREKMERDMPSFFQYDKTCRENNIPNWIFLLGLPS